VEDTVRLLGTTDTSVISTFVTENPGVDPDRVRRQVARLADLCRVKGVRFDMRPKVRGDLVEPYYTPGAALDGRCLYPFLYARVAFSGKVYFCPFIRIEVGDLTRQTLEDVWSSDRYVSLRRKLVENGIFPVCRRCCKVELSAHGNHSAVPAEEPLAAADVT
jgi:MoaA/NifB/PqqE/SkfB family radical SAM enzyme